MTINIITILALALMSIVCYAWGCTQFDRARNLEAQLTRKDKLLRDHMAAGDNLLATMAEMERRNAWLERQNMALDMQQRGGVFVQPVTWRMN